MIHPSGREKLERQLIQAINRDDYALAAKLRDELAKLGFNWIRTPKKPVGWGK